MKIRKSYRGFNMNRVFSEIEKRKPLQTQWLYIYFVAITSYYN